MGDISQDPDISPDMVKLLFDNLKYRSIRESMRLLQEVGYCLTFLEAEADVLKSDFMVVTG
jgi:hypothetical protein